MKFNINDFTMLKGDMVGYGISRKGEIYSFKDEALVEPFMDSNGLYVFSILNPLSKLYVKHMMYVTFVHSYIPHNLMVDVADGDQKNVALDNLKLTAKVDANEKATNFKRGSGKRYTAQHTARVITMYNNLMDTTGESHSKVIKKVSDEIGISLPTVRKMVMGLEPYTYVNFDKKSKYSTVEHPQLDMTDTAVSNDKSLSINDIVIINNPGSKNHNRVAQVSKYDKRRHLINVTTDGTNFITVRKDCLRKCRRKMVK